MPRNLTRLGAMLAAGATGLAAVAIAAPSASADDEKPKGAKNIILMIGDRMGYTHVTAARERFYGAAGQLNLQQADASGQVSTNAVDPNSAKPNLVTDSAATAWSSGAKTYNGGLGIDSSGNVVPTLMEQAKAAGMRTGNVSTAEITDATPAGMFSHALKRGCQGPKFSPASCNPDNKPTPDPLVVTPIAEQIARNGTADVIFGGGLGRFEPDDEQAMKAQGYQVLGSQAGVDTQTAATQRVATREELKAANAAKVIGLFNRGNLTVEQAKAQGKNTQEPALPEYTAKAIELLAAGQGGSDGENNDDGKNKGQDAKGSKGFLLQVEGALIDKRFACQRRRPDPDGDEGLRRRGQGGQGLRRQGRQHPGDRHRRPRVRRVQHHRQGQLRQRRGRCTPRQHRLRQHREQQLAVAGVRGKQEGLRPLHRPGQGSGSGDPKNFAPATFRTADDPAGVADGSTDASLWLTYLSGNHTGADVPIYAVGPQSARFTGPQDNTDIYRPNPRIIHGLRRGRESRPRRAELAGRKGRGRVHGERRPCLAGPGEQRRTERASSGQRVAPVYER
jgi:alkaline phosphatase